MRCLPIQKTPTETINQRRNRPSLFCWVFSAGWEINLNQVISVGLTHCSTYEGICNVSTIEGFYFSHLLTNCWGPLVVDVLACLTMLALGICIVAGRNRQALQYDAGKKNERKGVHSMNLGRRRHGR